MGLYRGSREDASVGSNSQVIPHIPADAPRTHSFSTVTNGGAAGNRNSDREALEFGILISHQEKLYGTNMFDAVQPEDAPEIEGLMATGLSAEGAVLTIFNRRYKGTERSVAPSTLASRSNDSLGSVSNYLAMILSLAI